MQFRCILDMQPISEVAAISRHYRGFDSEYGQCGLQNNLQIAHKHNNLCAFLQINLLKSEKSRTFAPEIEMDEMMINLRQQLEEFAHLPHHTEDELLAAFKQLAPYLLYGGYFLVDGKKEIYLDDIEFYYHEEREGGIKDPIMYHTNDHEGKEVPYFEVGRLNLHISGIDVTFENPNEQYRASFLIRGFHVKQSTQEDVQPYDPHSTHIYDEMLYMGLPLGKPIEIEWVENRIPGYDTYEPKGEPRQNVAKYKYNKEKGKYEKIVKAYSKSGKPIFEPCTRPWRFKKSDLKQ